MCCNHFNLAAKRQLLVLLIVSKLVVRILSVSLSHIEWECALREIYKKEDSHTHSFNNAILACIAMSLLFCILGCGILWDWVAKMSERNCEVLVYGE